MTLKNIVNLKFMVNHPANLCMACLSLVHGPWAIFLAADSMSLSSFTSIQRVPEKDIEGKVVRYGHSRSFKVIEIGSNRKGKGR